MGVCNTPTSDSAAPSASTCHLVFALSGVWIWSKEKKKRKEKLQVKKKKLKMKITLQNVHLLPEDLQQLCPCATSMVFPQPGLSSCDSQQVDCAA